MANTQFKQPRATRELPNTNIRVEDATRFVKDAQVHTTTYRDGITRRMLSVQMPVDLLAQLDVVSDRTRVSKRALVEEALSDLILKYKELL